VNDRLFSYGKVTIGCEGTSSLVRLISGGRLTEEEEEEEEEEEDEEPLTAVEVFVVEVTVLVVVVLLLGVTVEVSGTISVLTVEDDSFGADGFLEKKELSTVILRFMIVSKKYVSIRFLCHYYSSS
jgi:p-aminobenzoyl-glutamate transporter AbgT